MNIKEYPSSSNRFNMSYIVAFPREYEELPLLVYLHGAGERGDSADKIQHLYRHGVPKLISEGKEIPAVVLCPQCPTVYVWDNVVDRVKGIIDDVVSEYNIKKDRICITGSSMGGFGTWMMGKTYTNFFSAIAPVAGGGMSWRGGNLVKTLVFAYHGIEDTVVPPIYSELMVEEIRRCGGMAEYMPLEGLGHNDGIDYAYRNTDLIEKILSCRRIDFTPAREYCSEWF